MFFENISECSVLLPLLKFGFSQISFSKTYIFPLQGNYTCGKCKPGFVGDGFIGCRPGDLCASGKHNCHLNATCITLGSERFYCQVGRKIFR